MKTKPLIILASSATAGLTVPVIYGILSIAMRGSSSRESVLKPFFWLSKPAFMLGELIFGQAPIPILLILALYWIVLGLLVGLLLLVVLLIRRRASH